jgi:hypothetical protein
MDREELFKELEENPVLIKPYVHTLISGLELCQEIINDLRWKRIKESDSEYHDYVVSVNNIVRDILER